MGTTIDFNQPIEAIVTQLAGRIDSLESNEIRREAAMERRHEENRFRLNVILAILAIAVPTIPAIFAWVTATLKH
jgi:hypothetical protein